MKLPDFPLASWEVPPGSDVPLVAPANVTALSRWRERETEFLIRAIEIENEEHVFCREVGSGEAGNWLLPELTELRDIEHYAQETYESDLIRFSPDDSCRFFCFDGARYDAPGTHKLSVASGSGMWQLRNQRSLFRLPAWGEEFSNWRAASVGRMMRRQLEDPHSEVRIAFDWLHLSKDEQDSRLFGTSRDDLANMKRLMRHVLQLQHLLPSEMTATAHTWELAFNMDEFGAAPFSQAVRSESFYIHPGEHLAKWGVRLARQFLSRAQEDLGASQRSYPYKWIRVTVSPPTAHEKMEAAVMLREWCEQVGAQSEFAELTRD